MKTFSFLLFLSVFGMLASSACKKNSFMIPEQWGGSQVESTLDSSLLFARKKDHLMVLQFNIWQEGTEVTGGFEAIADEIARLNPDLVALSEVRNYNNQDFHKRILTALEQRGRTYYSFYSFDSGILSRFPLDSTASLVQEDIYGTMFKSIVTVPDYGQVAFYTAHMDYTHGANYMPRGYDPNTWQKLANGPITDLDSILKVNRAADRDESVALFLADAKTEVARGRLVVLCGDFNEPSALDWTDRTKDQYDHQGLVIGWPTTKTLEENGFVDAYRAVHPNEVTHPGFTFPSYNKNVPVSKLAWAPTADERDRIDFVFVYHDPHITADKAFIVGPQKSVVKGAPYAESSKDIFIEPQGIWPTDHKAVLIDFKLQ